MKKILSVLLTFAMLAIMVPSLAVSVNAADANSGTIKVTPVSKTENMANGTGAPINWDLAWNANNNQRLGFKANNDIEFVGKFAEPSNVTSFTITSWYYDSRINNITVSFSVDGTNWTNSTTIMGMVNKVNGKHDITFKSYDSETLFNYVKVSKPVAFKDAPDGFIWFDIEKITLSNAVTDGFENVYYVNKHPNAKDDIADLWNPKNETARNVFGVEKAGEVMIVGELADFEIIDTVFIKLENNNANNKTRNQSIVIEGSADGSKWEKVAETTSGNFKLVGDIVAVKTYNSNAYKFLRIVKNHPYSYGAKAFGIVTGSESFISDYAHYGTTAGFEDIWNIDREGQINVGGIPAGTAVHTGKFNKPTVIDKFLIKLPATNNLARLDSTDIEASVDGKTWTVIYDNLHIRNASGIFELDITDKTAYNYVRVVKQNDYTWSAVAFSVIPVAKPSADINFYASQSHVDTAADKWSLRLISSVNSLNYKSCGYEISVTGEGISATKNFVGETTKVSKSIIDNIGVRNAECLGGKYLLTATVDNISISKYGNLEFTVKPFAVNDAGEKVYFNEYSFTYCDGIYVG